MTEANPSENNQTVNEGLNESFTAPYPNVEKNEADSQARNLAWNLVEAQQESKQAETVDAGPSEKK